MIDFDEEYSCSIRSIATEKSSKINLTTRFLNGKMLMFYQKYQVDKCYLYQHVIDADSTSMFFVFICNLNCSVSEDKARNIIFDVMLKSEIFDRLDLSAECL